MKPTRRGFLGALAGVPFLRAVLGRKSEPVGGTYTLTMQGQTSPPIPYNKVVKDCAVDANGKFTAILTDCYVKDGYVWKEYTTWRFPKGTMFVH